MVIQFKLRAGGLAVWKRKYAAHRLWLKMTPLDQDLKTSQVNTMPLTILGRVTLLEPKP
jgi:hypothetical protein